MGLIKKSVTPNNIRKFYVFPTLTAPSLEGAAVCVTNLLLKKENQSL